MSPAAAGLPSRRARRAAGLRREELAELAGVSVDYVVRLEQGRATTPSVQVASALARALHLSDEERDHLYRLAGLAPPGAEQISRHIQPGMQRVLLRLGDTATAVFAADWQMLWWNRGWAALLGDPSATPHALRNFARDTFPAETLGQGPQLAHWPVTAFDGGASDAAVVSDLRRASGRYPRDRQLAALIRSLRTTNKRFADLWAAGEVSPHREGRKVVEHPAVGPVTVDCDVLIDADTDLKIVAMTAAPDTEDESKFRLALLSGVHAPARKTSAH
ncbi:MULTISPECIES: helix-turn-helix domain-containing protein [unclassified Nocardioides]|uniref:MmyB family transcriptional regulator n=1 Tax=unclassified Nocardioides TaxID=2615069 RepID=UPI001CECF1FE|nr:MULTISPECIES: helix-turn-helix domain-containing protein [unclassified Nocardioides]